MIRRPVATGLILVASQASSCHKRDDEHDAGHDINSNIDDDDKNEVTRRAMLRLMKLTVAIMMRVRIVLIIMIMTTGVFRMPAAMIAMTTMNMMMILTRATLIRMMLLTTKMLFTTMIMTIIVILMKR